MRNAHKRNAVLDFIGSKGADGATFSQIQRFIVELNGWNYDDMEPVRSYDASTGTWVNTGKTLRKWRGYWCDYFYGHHCVPLDAKPNVNGWVRKVSLFEAYCVRKPKGFYVLRKFA